MRNFIKKQKGITLIARVITIIVLLILVGVAVSMISGEDGILEQAAKAKLYSEGRTEFESVKLAVTAAMTHEKHMIEDKEILQRELNEYFDNAVASGTSVSGYKVTIGSNIYNVSSTGEILIQDQDILQSDIWSMSLIGEEKGELVSIRVKSKYKKISLDEYKDKYILKALGIEEQGIALDNLDDYILLVYQLQGLSCYSMEEVIDYYKQQTGQEITRNQLVYSMIVTGAETADAVLREMGYSDDNIEDIEQEWEELEQPEEIPDNIKDKTYTITYPNGEIRNIKGENLDTFSGYYNVTGNDLYEIKISDQNKENILRINIDNIIRSSYEDEYYRYKLSSDKSGYSVSVKDKTLTNYGEILTEIDGIPITNMNNTFYFCKNLTTAPEIPEGVITMESTFEQCVKLTKAPEIPDEVTNMKSTFEHCYELTEVPNIPKGVTNMESTFRNCGKLTKVPEMPDGVTNMEKTFFYCSELTEVPNIPKGVTNMKSTFEYCKGLTEVPEMPDGVTTMESTFEHCYELTDIPNIPTEVTNMNWTFSSCRKLTKVPKIPDGVTSMNCTFYTCPELTEVPSIPSGVTEMNSTFYQCHRLSGVLKINATNLQSCNKTLEQAAGLGTGLIVVVPNDASRELLKSNSSYNSNKVNIVASE